MMSAARGPRSPSRCPLGTWVLSRSPVPLPKSLSTGPGTVEIVIDPSAGGGVAQCAGANDGPIAPENQRQPLGLTSDRADLPSVVSSTRLTKKLHVQSCF